MSNNVDLKYHCYLCGATDTKNEGESFASFHRQTAPRGLELEIGEVFGYRVNPHLGLWVALVDSVSVLSCDEQHYRQYEVNTFDVSRKDFPLALQTGSSFHQDIGKRHYNTLYDLTQQQYQTFMERLKSEEEFFKFITQQIQTWGKEIRIGKLKK